MTLGTKLANLRKQYGFTQEELGNKLNISPQAISKWENNLSEPDCDTLIKISNLYHISIDDLLGNPLLKEESESLSLNHDVDKLIVKIEILCSDKDKVSINLPYFVLKVFLNKGNTLLSNDSLKNVDWNQIISMINVGCKGELVNIVSKDGDIVKISVE